MDGLNLIQDLAIVLLAAGLAGALCRRIGLSVIVGYLLAGMAIGPYTPPFSLLTDPGRIETLSQVGLVFLMFAIGLNLSLTKFRQLGVGTMVATGLGAILVLNLTRLMGAGVGWSADQSLFIAAMFMVSSSAVIGKVVQDLKMSHQPAGQLAMSITVMEDVVAVVMLAVLATKSGGGGESSDIGRQLLGISAFVVLLIALGLSLVPRLLRRLETRADPELRTITVAGVLFMVALVAAKSGYSVALGAFLLGAIVAEMPQRTGVERAFAGARDMFSSVFFVSIGLMIDVSLMVDVWFIILGLGIVMTLVRIVATSLAMLAVGIRPEDARRASFALTPIGEFSFLIAQLGVSSTVLPKSYYPVAVGVSVLTVFLAPPLNRMAPRLLRGLDKIEPNWLKRGIHTYHEWLSQISTAGAGTLWWRLSKGRMFAIGLEALFVTGLLTFSERIFAAIRSSPFAAELQPVIFTVGFWAVLGLLAIIPMVAIWRNLSTLSLIFAEAVSSRARLSPRVAELAFKIVAALALGYWLISILPLGVLPPLTWAILGVVVLAIVGIFSRRLVYWHSEWQHDVQAVLGSQKQSGPRWLNSSPEWALNVQELQLPEGAACAGRSIAELQIRSRFGCSIAEVDRGGYVVVAPDPTQRLYPGDRLLLLGSPEAIARASEELQRQHDGADGGFADARLEVVAVPDQVPPSTTLSDLRRLNVSGALVAGIERGGRHHTNLDGHEELLPGDQLLVLGAPDKIRDFRRRLRSFGAEGATASAAAS